jgi:hypothetical protein
MNYGLHICKPLNETRASSKRSYRFAVVDYNRSDEYPLNFVCMLPLRVHKVNKNSESLFVKRFGENSSIFAKSLLKNAFIVEKDGHIREEIQRRIDIIDTNNVTLIKCSICKKSFQPKKVRKYKMNLCLDCYKEKFVSRF